MNRPTTISAKPAARANRTFFPRQSTLQPLRPMLSPIARFSILLTALAGSVHALEATHADDANSAAADAVRAARETKRPDYKAMIGDAADRRDETLGGFGSGELSLVKDEAALYRDGEGELYGPSVMKVVGCRNADDPECRAIQVLDRGFPERPQIPDDMLDFRDDVIAGIGQGNPPDNMGGIGESGVCSDFTITTKPVYAEEVCRPGGWYDEATCRTGWEDGPASILTRWRCKKEAAVSEALACRIPVDFSTVTETIERCFFGAEAAKPESVSIEETSATATAVFPAVCEAPQYAEEEFTCDTSLTVTTGETCTIDEVTSARTTGDPSLAEDGCPGGTWLEMRHKCSSRELATRPSTHRFELELEGYAVKTLSQNGSVELKSPGNARCKAVIEVATVSCTGMNCIAPAEATVYHDDIPTGSITIRFPYLAYDRSAGLVDNWENGCAAFEEAADASSGRSSFDAKKGGK